MTLIEIMIVLAIIAGMATVIVSQVSKQFAKAKVNQARILISEVGKSLDQFYTDCGFYPDSGQGINALLQAPGGRTCSNWGPEPYLKKAPKDPWGGDLIYSSSDGLKYTLRSLGADRQEGGDGVKTDISSDD